MSGQGGGHREIAERNGWDLPSHRNLTENAAGASRYSRGGDSRDEWDRIVQWVRDGSVDVVMLRETSRGGRTNTWHEFVELCESSRVLISLQGALYDPSNTDHLLTLDISGDVAKSEARRTHDRVLDGKFGAAQAGRPAGKLQYGLTRVYDERGRLIRVDPNPREITVVEGAMRRYADDRVSLSLICADLNRAGIYTAEGRLWRPIKLKNLFRSPRWIGKREHLGVWYDAMWPPLVDEDLWYRVMDRMGETAHPQHRVSAKYLLSGIVRCSVCGAPLGVRADRSGRLVYQCKGNAPGQSKGCVTILKVTAEAIVEHGVWARLADPRNAAVWAEDDEQQRAERAAARRRLRELKQSEEDLLSSVEAGEVDERVATARIRGMRAEMEGLEEASRPRLRHPLLSRLAGQDVETIARVWDGLEMWQRREMLVVVTRSVELLRVGRGRRHNVDQPWDSFRVDWA